jgi:sulfur carrier protein ThiS
VVDDDRVSSPHPASAISVSVRLGARLGPGHRTVQLAAGATVADLLRALEPELGLEPRRLAGVAVAIGGEVVGRDRPLTDGALVLVLPVAGG